MTPHEAFPASLFAGGDDNPSMPACTVIPVLRYADVNEAAAWLCRCFGFRPRLSIGTRRVQLRVGSGAIVIAKRSVKRSGPTQFWYSMMIRVTDADRHYDRARTAGAENLIAPTRRPFAGGDTSLRTTPGDRLGDFANDPKH